MVLFLANAAIALTRKWIVNPIRGTQRDLPAGVLAVSLASLLRRISPYAHSIVTVRGTRFRIDPLKGTNS